MEDPLKVIVDAQQAPTPASEDIVAEAAEPQNLQQQMYGGSLCIVIKIVFTKKKRVYWFAKEIWLAFTCRKYADLVGVRREEKDMSSASKVQRSSVWCIGVEMSTTFCFISIKNCMMKLVVLLTCF